MYHDAIRLHLSETASAYWDKRIKFFVGKGWRKSFYYHFYEDKDADHHVAKHEGVTNGRAKLIHFYTLNKANSTTRVLKNLSLARESERIAAV
jgi:hypothetical protein